MGITWTPYGEGTATAVPTETEPDLYLLTAGNDRFYSFRAEPVPGLTPQATFATTNWYNLFFVCDTDRGSRTFKFAPSIREIMFRDGDRYDIGLEGYSRDGRMQTFVFDLQVLGDLAEPGVVVTSVTNAFIQIQNEMRVQLTGESVVVQPPPSRPPAGGAAETVRFLNQASFGATDATIAAVEAAGSYGDWIDQQLDLPASLTEPYTRAQGNSSNPIHRHDVWWRNAIEEPDQLRQRLAFAWSQIFVVSDIDYVLANSKYGMTNFYDMLAQLADGNFRTLLERVTLHPVMGIYLSMVRNEKADPARNVRPDENYAREVLQLFSIGLFELDASGNVRIDGAGRPIPTFDQNIIEQFAKVFTGWNYDGVRGWTDTNVGIESRVLPMVPDEAFHDTSEKVLLGAQVVPAGQTTYQDLTAALDNIFNHPNVGPFISRLLIQRLVTSNPSASYVGRVAAAFNNNGDGVRGDLRATVRALLLDEEARTGPQTLPTAFGKLKEPVMRLTNLWRALDVQPGPEEPNRVYRTQATSLYRFDDVTGQAPMRSPSVFNFFLPENPLVPGSDLAGPEMQILTEINVAGTNNMLLQCIYGDNNRSVEYRQNMSQIQLEPWVELASDPVALLDRIDLLLCAGQMPSAIRDELETLISGYSDDDEGRYARTVDSLYCIVGAPFHLVQK